MADSVAGIIELRSVLVVEDEPFLRMDIAEIFIAEGFAVVEASNADQALRILKLQFDFWAICTDVNMPGTMNGLKLAAAVRHRWPPIKIIVVSGNRNLTDADLPAGGRFVNKPYDREHIQEAIRYLING